MAKKSRKARKLAKQGQIARETQQAKVAAKQAAKEAEAAAGGKTDQRSDKSRLPEKVAIIGGGFSGITTAMTLLRESPIPIEISIIEKRASNFCGGVAYGLNSASSCHQTNIAAKRMGIEEDLPTGEYVDPDKVAQRHAMRAQLIKDFDQAVEFRQNPESSIVRYDDNAVGIDEFSGHVEIQLKGGERVEADRVVVATCNHEIKRFPAVSQESLDDPEFEDRYVSDQWCLQEKEEIQAIPSDESVLIIGTALSAYDAVRTLLTQGHTGPIKMISRNGYEHFRYPEEHNWDDLVLPTPEFAAMAFLDISPEVWAPVMLKEFRQLTSINFNPQTGELKRDPWYKRAFNGSKTFMPEQVLKEWEKYIPNIVENLGVEEYGKYLKKYGALINTLRVGAGDDICQQIDDAKKRGQLNVVAADIHEINKNTDDGVLSLEVQYIAKDDREFTTEKFYAVISSLCANQDYAKTKDPLWTDLMDKGYTQPHPVGVGVEFNDHIDGLLRGSNRIYAAGTPAAGENMIKRGQLGPPAFSVPGMRSSVIATAMSVLSGAVRDRVEKRFEYFDEIGRQNGRGDSILGIFARAATNTGSGEGQHNRQRSRPK